MSVVDRGRATRDGLAVQTAAGLTVTALGIVAFQVLTVRYGSGEPLSILLGIGLLAVAVIGGYTRRLWLVGAGFLMAIPLLLLFSIGHLLQLGEPLSSAWAVDAWWLSIGIMVAGIAIAMLTLSWHLAVVVLSSERTSAR
ncbi:hypothetical protein [Halopiger goleimassiliensis]|uniref:hypothetical protein n=1 Tax=Halopiger goleimassiliensis TaxID=1293048 RepID=UPI0006779B41|nr:hypothetical protein [Halopiger goleimassiliensis]